MIIFIVAKINPESKDQIIANLLNKKASYETIKSIVKCGNSRIWLISLQIKNGESIQSAKIGRPPKVNQNVINTIEYQTIHDPTIGGNSLSSLIASNLGIDIYSTRVNLIRNQLKFRYTHTRRLPFMTQQYIRARLSFCDDQLQNEINWESGVIFSDES